MPKTTIQLRVDDDLLAKIDAEATRLGQSRTTFLLRCAAPMLGPPLPQVSYAPASRPTAPGKRDVPTFPKATKGAKK